MNAAEQLREAAALMRARAEAATEGPWMNTHLLLRRGGLGLAVTQHPLDGGKFVMCDPQSDARKEDAEHIASWHPAVALAVADWLDACALVTEVAPDRHKGLALAVARTYLGTDTT